MISVRQSKNAISGLRDMVAYINEIKPTTSLRMAEIGCYAGDSTRVFAENFEFVYCIDPWQNGYDNKDLSSYKYDMKDVEAQFDENMKPYENFKKIKQKSEDACKLFDFLSLDLVYIDALHTYIGVKKDRLFWIPMIKEGGFLCGHDYQPRFQGVIDAVNEFKKPDKVFKDTSWIIQI